MQRINKYCVYWRCGWRLKLIMKPHLYRQTHSHTNMCEERKKSYRDTNCNHKITTCACILDILIGVVVEVSLLLLFVIFSFSLPLSVCVILFCVAFDTFILQFIQCSRFIYDRICVRLCLSLSFALSFFDSFFRYILTTWWRATNHLHRCIRSLTILCALLNWFLDPKKNWRFCLSFGNFDTLDSRFLSKRRTFHPLLYLFALLLLLLEIQLNCIHVLSTFVSCC